MTNLNNLCIFEGRITQNQKYSQVNGQNGPIDKVFFSVSVPRALTAQQRQDPNAKKNDFVNFSLMGAQVKTLQQYFPAGTPIKVYARYTEYESIDATGQKKFGHVFEVESIGFVVSPAQNQQNGQTNGGNNNYQHNAPQQSNNNYSNQNQQPVNNQGNFQMFGESEFPF